MNSQNTELLDALQDDKTIGAARDEVPGYGSNQPTEKAKATRRESRRAKEKYAPATTEELRRRFYDFADLSAYRWKDRLTIRTADFLFYVLIRLIGSTIRWEKRGAEHLDSIYADGHQAIFTFWHACIFTAAWFWRGRGIVVMSSQSKDGEFTSRLIKRLGSGTARGSSTRGAGRALAEMTFCLDQGIDVAFTIDGPRGPAYVAKPGAITLARHSGHAVFPFHIAVKRYMELPSWDRLQIPLPFTRAMILMAEPIYVTRESGNQEVEVKQAELQAALDRLRQEGEAWRQGI